MASTRGPRGAGTRPYRAHAAKYGCPPISDGERPAHRCKAPYVVSLSLTVGGTRRRITAQRKTKTEALDELDRMRLKLQQGIIPESVSLADWLEHWLAIRDDEYQAGELKWSALIANRGHVKNWLTPLLGKVKLQDLTPEHVRQLKRALAAANLKPQTQRNVHTTLRAALARAMADRRISYNPAQVERAPRRPKTTAVGHRALTVDQVRAMLSRAETTRELARVAVGLTTAMRPGEIRALQWESVDLTVHDGVTLGTIRVEATLARVEGTLTRTEPKTTSSVRTVPLIPLTAAALQAWRAESGGDGFVFYGYRGARVPESAERDSRAWAAVARRAGVEGFTPHGGRATTGSVLMSLHVPLPVIADILGHSQVSTTADWYMHSDATQRAEAMAQLGAVLESPNRKEPT